QGFSPLSHILLYNTLNGTFQQLSQSSPNSSGNNNTFVFEYSPTPKPGILVNITGAYTMNYGMANSNMFKLLFECGPGACAWDSSLATLRLVYINQDTKIFRVDYNLTSNQSK
ncbi:MAG: hypothetical protein KGH71_06565, partial [Candidatus Micrarchaeota archaeon]|nr:hypothetical protein [Candidatus Micrarchaeota archaeon]